LSFDYGFRRHHALPSKANPMLATFAATQQFDRFRSEADIERFSVYTGPVAFAE